LLIYENKDTSSVGGLLNKKAITNVIKLEHDMIAWNKTSDNFINKEFNGKVNVAWGDLCFAGRDAEIDPRTGAAKCNKDSAYFSAVSIFTDEWKA
jgi:hypothetical protein